MNDTDSRPEVNSHEFWDMYMTEAWDANDGRRQTQLFARYFLDTVALPANVRTLLDVSCAKGDALPEFRARYPELQLFGADISDVAIVEARKSYGQIAQFSVGSFNDVSRQYDIIFCSNTLEHFENYLDIAQDLLSHCKWLYVLVPYMELRDGKRLSRLPDVQHVATFDKHSFAPLIKRGAAGKIRCWVRHTPGAWGTRPVRLRTRIKAFLRGRQAPIDYRQIFYEVSSATALSQASG